MEIARYFIHALLDKVTNFMGDSFQTSSNEGLTDPYNPNDFYEPPYSN